MGWRAVATVLITVVVASCGGRPTGLMTPYTAALPPGTSRVDLVVITTRARDQSAAELFSGERGPTISFAEIAVSIPPDAKRVIGEVQWPSRLPPDPAVNFTTVSATSLDRDGVRHFVVDELKAMKRPRRVFVFVHGYNNRFDDAVYRFAQIVHDSGAEAVPILFTWPSRAKLLAYGYDRESANYSRDALEEALTLLAQSPLVDEVSVLAHSMGNWVTLEALRQMAIRHDGHILPKIKNVMLAAPDVDVDVFRTQIEQIKQPRPSITVFVSRDDKALAVSRSVWGSSQRLGSIDPDQEPYRSELEAEGMQVVDMSKIHTADALNHGKFAESPEIVRLIGNRLVEGQKVNDMQIGIGDRIAEVTTTAGTAVGATAGLIISAPVAVVDSATRNNYGSRVKQVGDDVASGTAAATAADTPPPPPLPAGTDAPGTSPR